MLEIAILDDYQRIAATFAPRRWSRAAVTPAWAGIATARGRGFLVAVGLAILVASYSGAFI